MNELIIEAKLENLNTVQDFVSEWLGDCPIKIQNQIGITVDEIFSNIARYAYHPDVGGVTIRIVVDDDITIEFEDSGVAYDPLAIDMPDTSLTVEEREIGGLGIFMVKNLMDSVEYRRNGDKNILTIRKRILNMRGIAANEKTFLHMFQKQAEATPDNIAINDRTNCKLTYRDTDRFANYVSRTLSRNGVEKGDIVAIMTGRSAIFPVCCIGAFKAGAAYMPIDPRYSASRIKFMLEDSGAAAFITSKEFRPLAADYQGPVLDAEELMRDGGLSSEPVISGEDINYVIYTSGTTGKPKGAVNAHRGLANLIRYYTREFEVVPEDVADVYSSFSFDASVFQIFPPLTKGACIDIIPDDILMDMYALSCYMREHGVTISCMPPAAIKLFEPFCKEKSPLRLMLSGGDRLTCPPSDKYKLYNLYGPTEASVCVAGFPVDKAYVNIPIGKAVEGNELYIVDENLEPVPEGAEGELCVAGLSVGIGYWKREDLTKERFIKNPFSDDPDMRTLYRTGDVCRRLPDGNIEFLGRIDTQVKLHGYRIELGEIETALRACPGIRDAICAVFEEEEKYIAGYYVSDSVIADSVIREKLSAALPAYMIPFVFERIEKIPLSTNGKFDRKALKPGSRPTLDDAPFEPKSGEEKTLAAALSEIFKTDSLNYKKSFIENGGDSISAIRLISQLHKSGFAVLASDILDSENSLSDIAKKLGYVKLIPVKSGSGTQKPTDWSDEEFSRATAGYGRGNVGSIYDLSPTQSGMLYHYMIDPKTTAYINQVVYKINGDLDIILCRKVFALLARKYPVLKTAIACTNIARPKQMIITNRVIEVKGVVLKEESLEKIARRDLSRGFDYENDNLFRVTVIQEKGGGHYMLLSFAHIILDGWSVGNIINDFSVYYKRLADGEPLRTLEDGVDKWLGQTLSYQDFISYLDSLDRAGSEAHFAEALRGYDIKAVISPDFRNESDNKLHLEETVVIPPRLAEEILRTAQECGVTVSVVYEAIYGLALQKFCGSPDVVFAKAILGRNFPIKNIEQMAGLFINTIPARVTSKPDDSFLTLLRRVMRRIEGDRAHEPADLANIQKLVQQRDILFPTLFTYNQFYTADQGGLPVEFCYENQTSHYDLVFIAEPGDEPRIRMQYNSFLYSAETICGFLDSFVFMLEQLSGHPEKSLSEVESVKNVKEVISLCLGESNNEWLGKTYTALFAEQVLRTPDSVAVKDCLGNVLTYRELDNLSNAVASAIAEAVPLAGAPVAVVLSRTALYPLAALSVMKARLAFLPIDPSYPDEQIDYILEDSGAGLIVTEDAMLDNVRAHGINAISISAFLTGSAVETPFERFGEPGDLAYIIYTSGSTGKPKGVQITHGGLVNLCKWSADLFGADAVAMSTLSFHFDASIEQIFPRFLTGGRVFIADDAVRNDIPALAAAVEREGVTYLTLTAALAGMFMDAYSGDCLQYFGCGGEKLNISKIPDKYKLYNLYGPTEYTVTSTFFHVDSLYGNIPIGKPVYNTSAMVLDSFGRLLPQGAIGQLALSGRQISRGYIGNREMTDRLFAANPYAFNGDTGRMYLTGDMAKLLRDGNIEFLGRADNQVKVRGYRIELGGVETVMGGCPLVREAVVITRRDSMGNAFLCCYYTADSPADNEQLAIYAGSRLPSYMVPSVFVHMPKFPLTLNGKIDTSALPETVIAEKDEYEAPVGEMETRIAEVYSKLLGLERFSRNADFFEMGGTSILAIGAVTRIKRFYDVTINELFEFPVLKKLAAELIKREISPDAGLNVAFQDLGETSGGKRFEEARNRYLDTLEEYREIDVSQKSDYKTILLAGATGYLGIYLLNELIARDIKVYAIVRAEDNRKAARRLAERFGYYFHDKALPESVEVFAGDLSRDHLGLSKTDYETLSWEVDAVVNSAANVKHFGHYEEFVTANVTVVENLLDFCKVGKKKDFVQTSTVSVAEGNVDGAARSFFSEDDLDIGQRSDNYYLKTKLQAEKTIVAARGEGLCTTIFRLGNITIDTQSRTLQYNITENAFYSILSGFINTSSISREFGFFELSFVNQCADAICRIMFCDNLKNGVYHIMSDKIADLARILTEDICLSLNVLDGMRFTEFLSQNHERTDIGSYILEMMAHLGRLDPDKLTTTAIQSDRTVMLLEKLGFRWEEVDVGLVETLARRALKDRMDFLRSIPSLRGLTENCLFELAGAMESRVYEANSYIRHENKKYDELIILHTGLAEEFITSISGWEGTVEIAKSGEIIGIESLFNKPSNITLESVFDEAVVLAVKKDRLRGIAKKYPELALALVSLLEEKLARSQRLWVSIE